MPGESTQEYNLEAYDKQAHPGCAPVEIQSELETGTLKTAEAAKDH